MKLFYRVGGSSGKFLVNLLFRRIVRRPDQRESAERFLFSS
jgi:hypothetical protein